MKQLLNRLYSFFNTLESKIAFYPTLLAFLGFNLAFLMLYLENSMDISKNLMEIAPQMIVEKGDTALTIISTCIAGLISMMVFSFSMVMLLLSQASSNYSPRLLPGLISDKNHQVILGVYLMTILYNIFILFAIEPGNDKYELPGISILLGIILTILCICSFIYFIHNISQSIQITNILDNIFKPAEKRLIKLVANELQDSNEIDFPDSKDWYEYETNKSGYFQNIAINNLINHCIENDNQLHILPAKGMFILTNVPVFRSKNKLDDDTVNNILANFNFSRGELVTDNYTLAFKQITEVIVKAMSPGVNDPGTALNGIDYLTELFALRMKKRDTSYVVKNKKAIIKLKTINFEELLYHVTASIRIYSKQDVTVVHKMLLMFKYLLLQKCSNTSYKEAITKEATALFESAKLTMENDRDISEIKKLMRNFSTQKKASEII